MILNESFEGLEEFRININQIKLVYYSPDKVEKLSDNITLYYKRVSYEKLGNLFLATQDKNGESIISFAYWIPSELIQEGTPLINLLEIFANNFGLKFKLGGKEAYFSLSAKVLSYGKLETPFQILTILGSSNIPLKLWISYRENSIAGINWIYINYCFVINNNRYSMWLDSIETVSIENPIRVVQLFIRFIANSRSIWKN